MNNLQLPGPPKDEWIRSHSELNLAGHQFPSLSSHIVGLCNYPLIELISEDRVSRGFERGTKLAKFISESWNLTAQTVFRQYGSDALMKIGENIMYRIGTQTPEIAQEMEGISQGAEIESWKIALLNGRALANFLLKKDYSPTQQCTSLGWKKQQLVGQNLELLKDCLPHGVIIKEHRNQEPWSLTITEPAALTKIGFNPYIAFCVNTVRCRYTENKRSIPLHILLRKLIDTTSLNEAASVITKFNQGIQGAITILSEDQLLSFELTSRQAIRVTEQELSLGGRYSEFSFHANCFESTRFVRDPDSSTSSTNRTIRRKEQSKRVLSNLNSRDIQPHEKLLTVLSDRSDPEYPLFSDEFYIPSRYDVIATHLSVVMDLQNLCMHITHGDPKRIRTIKLFE